MPCSGLAYRHNIKVAVWSHRHDFRIYLLLTAADLGSCPQLQVHNVVICTIFDHLTRDSCKDSMSCSDSMNNSKKLKSFWERSCACRPTGQVCCAFPAMQELGKFACLSWKEIRGSLHSGLAFLPALCRHTTVEINATA